MNKSIKNIPVFLVAKKDISNYLKEINIEIYDNNDDVWVVTPSRINTKETSILNRKLGLHKVNLYGEKMNRQHTKQYE